MATKHEILHHVGYEWWMFQSALSLLDRMDPASDPIRNALLEIMIVHGRGLIYFFCHKERFATDWNYDDVGIAQSPEPAVLKDWREAANGRIMHLTELREKPHTAWKATEVRDALEQLIKGLRGHPDLPKPSWIGDETNLGSKHWQPPLGASGGHASQPTPPAPPPQATPPSAPPPGPKGAGGPQGGGSSSQT
jgi:hypothetical protein